jgi:hypothetical protein
MQKMQCATPLILGALLFLSGFLACNDNLDDYSRNPQDRLAFSIDTLSFDTVLTTVNSPVKTFMVYNPNKKPLLISSVGLEEGENSHFKINVDGFAGSAFEDIEIRANDSIYVLVSVKPAETGQSAPTLLNDHIVFTTNSVRQKVTLQAYSQDVYKWQGLVLNADTILSNSKPFLIYDSLVIQAGVTVEVREGTTFYMANNALLMVRGTLKIKGTVDQPVIFRGSRTDKLPLASVSIPYDLIPGQWQGIVFDSISYNNEFENVYIRNGRFGMSFELSDPYREKIKMKNVMLTNVSGTLVEAVNCNIVAENCEFSNAKDYLLDLVGGRYKFTHCTVANYYPSLKEAGWGNSRDETLHLSDSMVSLDNVATEHYPVLGFEVSNSIIAGNMSTSGISIPMHRNFPEPLAFRNCVLTDTLIQSPNIRYTDCIFKVKTDSLFKKTNCRTEELSFWPVFDFGLSEKSPARNAGDFEISKQIPLDIKGINRLEDGLPDAGAYEFIDGARYTVHDVKTSMGNLSCTHAPCTVHQIIIKL